MGTNHSFDILAQEIGKARSIGALRDIGATMPDAVSSALNSGSEIREIVQLISRTNSSINLRLIQLLEQHEGICLPPRTAFLALGSEGRGEQTLRTDQDSAIIYADGLPPEQSIAAERFAARFVDALEEIGVPRCPGNIMASNPRWRHSLSEWQEHVKHWISAPTPEHMLNFGIFQDLRPLHGDSSLGMQLRTHIRVTVHKTPFFFPNMACHAVRFPTPLTFFGSIRVEGSGENRGMVDIKKAGIFAITVGSTLLALELGYMGGTTWEKLELLGQRRIITARDLETIRKAYSFLVQLRLRQQIIQLSELPPGGTPSNFINLKKMSDTERDQLRKALKGVSIFLRILRTHYKLDYISS